MIKRNKYNNTKITACPKCWSLKCKCGLKKIKFDSKKEWLHGLYLKVLEKNGEITNLERQYRIMLIPGLVYTEDQAWIFAPCWTKKEAFEKLKDEKPVLFYPPFTYRSDFKYFNVKKNQTVYVDVKGVRLPRFSRVEKLMEALNYNLEVV